VPSNTVTEFSNTRSPAGDHWNGPTLSAVSSLRQLLVPLPGLTLYSLVATSKVTSAVPPGGEKTHAPAGSGMVLVAAIGGGSVEATTVVAVVGGTVLLGEPIGRKCRCAGRALVRCLHAVTMTMMPITDDA
jgi:hypothetical protein